MSALAGGPPPVDRPFCRSGAYASKLDFENALKDAEKCVELKSDWPKGWSRKGYAAFQLGDYATAMESYKKGLELDPNNSACLEGLENIRTRIYL